MEGEKPKLTKLGIWQDTWRLFKIFTGNSHLSYFKFSHIPTKYTFKP